MDLDRLDAKLTELSRVERFSGVVRLEVAGDLLFESGYGLASRAWQIPCSPRMRFESASITKLFTAAATLQQVDAGAFALDTGVTEYLGLPARFSSAITPYHLLTHTSGIGDDADEEAGESYAALFAERPNYCVTETEEHVELFIDKPPNFVPGEGCRYCNAAYVLLGLMVERATNVPYRDYVASRVFVPVGMDRSGFYGKELVETDIAEGSDPVVDDTGKVTGWRRNIYAHPPLASPAGGAHVTAEDLARFHTALRDGRLLDPESTAAMLTPKERLRPRGSGWHMTGFGFEFETDADGAVVSYWKEGIDAGVSGELCHYPNEDLTIAVLSNMEDGAWEPIKTIDGLVTSPAV